MVPIRLDIYSVLIFLGAIQGLFVSIFFFRAREARLSQHLLGFFVLTLTGFCIDIFLGYSGYMARVLHLVDFTETLNFVMAPLLYLYVVVTLDEQKQLRSSQYLHFAPAVIYLLYFLLFFMQSIDYKYNAYVDAYHPHLPRLDAPATFPVDPLLIKDNISLLQIIHLGIYITASIRHYVVWSRDRNGARDPWVRSVLIGAVLSFSILVAVKLTFERDFGEYILGTKTMVIIYALTFYLLSKSAFFKGSTSFRGIKYEKSTLPEDRIEPSIQRLKQVMEEDHPYLDPSFSLPFLADKLNLSTHHLSQILNGHLNQNFYEFTASYRVEAAKSILAGKDSEPMPIEQIAEQVGYYSKSSFNTAFKKQTGMTPSEFRKNLKH